jgi:hypothetical protein
MYKWIRFYVVFLGCMMICSRANANNIVVSNVALEEIDTSAGMATIRFDVSWGDVLLDHQTGMPLVM